MFRKRPKSKIPELVEPGDFEPERCSPGSIEQQLDMCDEGELKGDLIEHHSPDEAEPESYDLGPEPLDEKLDFFEPNMSEADREGDEMSGDDHSFGLQGGEQELLGQEDNNRGLPGDETVWQGRRSRELPEDVEGGKVIHIADRRRRKSSR